MNQKISLFVAYLFFLNPAFGQCDLENIEVNTGQCHDDLSYTLSLSTIPSSMDVDLYINSEYLGYYQLTNSGIVFDSFSGNGITKDTLRVCQNDQDSCCLEILINNPCLCGFADIEYEIFDCVESDSTYFIQLDFEPQNNGSSFTVGGNATNYGTFEYSALPITLGPLAADETAYEFIFFDNEDALCFDFIEIGQVDCVSINACSIENVSAEVLPCNSTGLFNVLIDFEVSNPGEDGFTIQGNGQNYGTFAYGEATYELGPFAGDCSTLYEFAIIDLADSACSDFTDFEEPICCDVVPCEIWDLTLEQACEPWFGYVVNFEYANMPSNQFDLFIDEMFLGTFNYNDLPLSDQFDFPMFTDPFVTLTVVDSEVEECFAEVDNIEIGCEESCSISNLFAEVHECNGQMFQIDFEFDEGINSNGFVVYLNGAVVAEFEYGETFYTIGPFEDDCSGEYELLLVDETYNDCASDIYLIPDPMCCETIECSISEITIEMIECDEENMSFVLNFEHQGTSNEFFDVYSRDGLFDFFQFENLPLTIEGFPNTGNQFEFIQICENDNPDCCTEHEWDLGECFNDPEECSISEITIELIECDEENMSFVLDFNHMGTTNNFFHVFSRDGFFDAFTFSDLPISISGFPNTGNMFEFIKVCQNENADCCAEHEWDLGECFEDPNECSISEITIDMIECNEENMSFVLDFNHSGTTNDFFDVSSRDGFFGFYAFDQLPITINDFPNTGNMFEFIKVCENDNQECCLEHEWDLGECFEDPNECSISEITIDMIECNEENMSFVLDFNHSGTTNDFFDVSSRDGFFGFYAFDQLPITINDFPNTGNMFEFIKVCENDNEECCLEHEWDLGECNDAVSTQDPQVPLPYTYINPLLTFNSKIDQLVLYDINGQIVKIERNQSQVLLDQVLPGVYFVRATKGTVNSVVKLFKL